MSPDLKRSLRRWIPPAAVTHLNAWRKTDVGLSGAYSSWDQACAKASSYDSNHILERVLQASRQVRDGHAAYERDSVLFDHVEHSFPLLATLLRAALEGGHALSVVDFGGSLGSSYRECRAFLGDHVRPLRWAVVEQASFVEAGRREMQNEELDFFSSIDEAVQGRQVDVLLLSAVLQYLPDPHQVIDQALRISPRYLVLDRTIVSRRSEDLAHVQSVPDSIYRATYPVWSLSRERLLQQILPRFALISEHPSLPFPALLTIDAEFKGYIFKNNLPQ